jgi:hypothetical protein
MCSYGKARGHALNWASIVLVQSSCINFISANLFFLLIPNKFLQGITKDLFKKCEHFEKWKALQLLKC